MRRKRKERKITAKEKLKSLRAARSVKPIGGFGLDPMFKAKPIKRLDVVIDENTSSDSKYDKHILYVPGWSLKIDT